MPLRARLVLGAIVLIIAGTAAYMAFGGRGIESTDDAFIDGHVANVAAQIDGRVEAIDASDNQRVRKGDRLVQLDRRDGEVRLAQAQAQKASAEAQLAQVQAQLKVQAATIEQTSAQLSASQTDAEQAAQDLERFKTVDPHAITRQQFDVAQNQARATTARLQATRRGLDAARAQLAVLEAQGKSAQAAVESADAQIRQARLDLDYTEVRAPFDGLVTKRTVEVGNVIKAGTSLVSLVSEDVWVTANFKETQLARIRPGQAVSVAVDALQGKVLKAHVDSIQAGTGSVFSTLPVENATGNFVKVVQRVPVKIVFEPHQADAGMLLPGLSVVPRVDTRSPGSAQ